ncbi:MAG: C39 family peptidase [Ignavibacteriaceae bacterium]
MKFFNFKLFLFSGLLFLIFQSTGRSQLVYTGIEKEKVEPVYSERLNPEWCWAASVQLILNYYGAKVSQEDIIKRSFSVRDPYGELPAWSKNFDKVSDKLNRWVIWYKRVKYIVSVKFVRGAPSPETLMSELKNNYPVIMADSDSTNGMHAVICTAVGILPSYYGTVYKEIMVRDTYPDCRDKTSDQRVNWAASEIPKRVSSYWLIHVKRLDHLKKK